MIPRPRGGARENNLASPKKGHVCLFEENIKMFCSGYLRNVSSSLEVPLKIEAIKYDEFKVPQGGGPTTGPSLLLAGPD